MSEKNGAELMQKAISIALKSDIVNVNREAFLRKELSQFYTDDIVNKAVKGNPAKAGISRVTIDRIAKRTIDYETAKVTAISAAASLPGGVAAAASATADIASYFIYILRAAQKLAFLYGFDEFDINEENLPDEVSNKLMILIGVMFGVDCAIVTLNKVANLVAQNAARNIVKQALTKKFYWPIVKAIGKAIGEKVTKQVFADTVASAIPYVSCVLSGGLTYAMFRPGCVRLMHTLQGYKLCDPEFYKNPDNPKYSETEDDIIDAEFIVEDDDDSQNDDD